MPIASYRVVARIVGTEPPVGPYNIASEWYVCIKRASVVSLNTAVVCTPFFKPPRDKPKNVVFFPHDEWSYLLTTENIIHTNFKYFYPRDWADIPGLLFLLLRP